MGTRPDKSTLDTYQRQLLQQRIDAIRANVRERYGRDLSHSEVDRLRRLIAREITQDRIDG